MKTIVIVLFVVFTLFFMAKCVSVVDATIKKIGSQTNQIENEINKGE